MSNRIVEAARRFLADMGLFSEHVVGLKLRAYQVEPVTAVVDSILHGRGDEFVWIFARQSGKNETVSHLETYLLNLYQRRGGSVIHTAPTGGQTATGLQRLRDRMNNRWNTGHWKNTSGVSGVEFGAARGIFLSGHPRANVRGATASLLLVHDEFQDFDLHTAETVFAPMCASTNATRLYIGTPKTSQTALAQKRRELEKLTQADGRQRVFIVDWQRVASEVPVYGHFVRSEIRKKGERHPSVITEFWCEELDATGGLFDARRMAMMRGAHRRQFAPTGGLYVALLDVAGEDEGEPGNLLNPGRDYTVCWMVEVVMDDLPRFKFVDCFTDQGGKHFDQGAGSSALNRRLAAWLEMWGVSHVVADASGVGLGLVSDLRAKLGEYRVTPYVFGGASKAKLGTMLLATIETGRFAMYADADEHTEPSPAGAGFWLQVRQCAYEIAPDLPLERGLRWAVPDNAKYDTTDDMGNSIRRAVHDDYLLAAGLVGEVDRLIQEGKIALGNAVSVVIEAEE